MKKPNGAAPLALVVLVLFTACLVGARAPNVPPRGTLAPGEEGLVASEGPFGVVFASPRGATDEPSEVTVVFNRPMRPLDLAGDEAAPPISITPAAKGRWSWLGTTALAFVPEDHLARATEFTVEVPATTRALDGSTLGKPFSFKFTTARPALVRAYTKHGRDALEPDEKFELRFNQPVEGAEIARAVALEVGGKKVAFDVRRSDPSNEMAAFLAPRQRLPLATPIELTVSRELRGKEGPLPATKEGRFSFATYGPLVVRRLACSTETPHGRCSIHGGFTVELSNPVRAADLKRALRIEPPVKIQWPSWYGDDAMLSSISVSARFVPGRSHRVSIAGGIKDEHGQKLAQPWSSSVSFDDLWPTAEIGLIGSLFEPAARKAVPVASINVASYELATARLDEDQVLAMVGDTRSSGAPPKLDQVKKLRGASARTVKPTAATNAVATETIDPAAVLGGKDARGPLAIAVGYTDRPGTRWARATEKARVAQVTDLAVSAKVSPHGSLVWVTHLSTGAPVANASVWIRRSGGARQLFSTDASGIALVPQTAFAPVVRGHESAVVFAKAGDDWTYRAVADALPSYRYGVSVDFGDDRPFGLAFTDRGIYRPGDVVHVKAIFRKEAHPGTSTPVGRPVNVSVEGPDGEPIAKPSASLSRFGTMAFDVKVPDTARLGTYAIHASVDGSPRDFPDVNADFEVAEYRPAEFKVGVESSRPAYVRGDAASWTARGDFLFGAPMAGADAQLTVTRTESSFTPPGLSGWATDDAAFTVDVAEGSQHETMLHNATTKLDPKGTAVVSTALAMPGQHRTELVTCEAQVTDISRQVIAGSSTALVHPGEFYVALKPGADVFVKAGDAVKPEVLTVDPSGRKVPGVAVKVELVRRTWTVAKQAVGGGFREVTRPEDKQIATCTATTGAAPSSCSLATAGAGYYLVRASAQDARKNPVAAAYGFYATGEGETSWGGGETMAVELVPDRKSYEVGQTARVLVKSPWKAADALVTIERAGVYTKRRVTLAGAMPTIDVPITDDLRPNAFVSVLIVRGRSKAPPAKVGASDVGAPAFRLGYAALPVNPEARRLEVKVRPGKTDYRPGEGVEVDLEVTDRAGRPARAEVALYAADEGVLSLVHYKTPDPVPVFGAARALGVATVESREAIARVLNPFADLGLDKGFEGGGGGLEPGMRKDFRASVTWMPALLSDEKGRIHASFKLPDGLTTYRVMAVATAEDDRTGYGESRVTTSRPLMARPALPRFVRAGDAFDASVIVTSKGMAKSKVDVDVAVTGLVLRGDARKTIELEANASAEVRFAMAATTAGKARLRFHVKGGAAEDSVELTRDVVTPTVMEAVALYGETTKASAERLGDLSAIREDVGGLEVSLASTALVGLGGGVEQLVDYPYGCTEQLTSKLVPLLPLRDLAADFKLKLPADLDATVRRAVKEILAHQRGDGGFGFWKESADSSAWVSAYALWGLSEAKRRGVEVPKTALTDATRYVRATLRGMDKDDFSRATAPFVLDVLAQVGEPDPGGVTRAFEEREALPLFSRALLLHAMVLSKSEPKSAAELAKDLEAHVRIDADHARAVENQGDKYAVLLDSNARTSALVLRALLAHKPGHPLGARLARGLLADRRGGTWRTTQETAWALLALDDYRRAQEKVAPDFDAHVFLGESHVFEAAFKGRGVEQPHTFLPAAGLARAKGAPLAFSVDGSGKLFYEARLRYAKKEMPKKAIERGFFVRKTLRAVTPGALEEALKATGARLVTSFAGGDLVLGEVVVITPSPRNFVVIDDPLPAGFEAIDARLATTGGGLDVDAANRGHGAGDGDDNDDQVAKGVAFRASQFLREVRDDRVLFFIDHMPAGMFRYRYLARATALGTFQLPPTKAEEMYKPEVFGRSAADVVKVSP